MSSFKYSSAQDVYERLTKFIQTEGNLKLLEPAPVKMPEGMTYDELCDEIERSGLKFGRPWYDFSARVGMTPDYFERIATRRGNPSRHTMEQVYAAFFTPFA